MIDEDIRNSESVSMVMGPNRPPDGNDGLSYQDDENRTCELT